MPPPHDPATDCDSDNRPENVSGIYFLCAEGTAFACVDGEMSPVPNNLALVVVQSPGDLSKGTVTLTGTGHPLVDGVPLDATFIRRRFEAVKSQTNLPAACLDEHRIAVAFDFEGFQPGAVSLFELHTRCTVGDYCKGSLNAKLFLQ